MKHKTFLLSAALLASTALMAQTPTPVTNTPPAVTAPPVQQNAAPANTPQTQSAPALPPCPAPKPLSVWERAKQKIKQHAEGIAVAEVSKEDRKIAQTTKDGNPGLADTAATAANAANQPKPCTPVPVKKTAPPAKQ
jgi:hypothetical protein